MNDTPDEIVAAGFVLIVLSAIVGIILVWRFTPGWLVRTVPQLAKPNVALQARVWLTSVAVSVVVGAIPLLVVGDQRLGTLGIAGQALGPSPNGVDSWRPMIVALRGLISRPDVPIYDAVWDQGIKFQYPLASILPIDPLVRVFHLDEGAIVGILNIFSWIAFIVLGALTAMVWARLHSPVEAPFWQAVTPRSLTVLIPAGVAGAAVFYPLTFGVYVGQIQTTLGLLVCVAVLAWCSGRKTVAGVALALCCIVKPQWVLIGVWALLRREWRVAAAGVITAGAAFGLSILVYGANQVFGYVDLLLRLGSLGEVYYPNQSINGLLNRLLFTGDNLVFSGELPAENPIVRWGTLIVAAALLSLALVWRVRSRPTVIELAIVMLTLTIVAPIAWEHHYGITYFLFAVLMVAQFRRGSPGRVIMVLTGTAYLLISQNLFQVANLLNETWLNVLQSYMFAGGILLLALLYIQSARDRGFVALSHSSAAPEVSPSTVRPQAAAGDA